MTFQKFVLEITQLHRECIPYWKDHTLQLQHQEFLRLVEENHAFNFQLWHAEDRARSEDKGFEYVYQAKREIDHCNQQRNNRMEAMDEALFIKLKPNNQASSIVHSETPGMIIDRLSILALKSYHMGLQVHRQDVDEAHKISCKKKFETITLQLSQLETCLWHFLDEVQNSTRTFRVYHQFKMYNDPKLNPELVAAGQ